MWLSYRVASWRAALGLVRHDFDPALRHDVNVVGTKRLLEYYARYAVKRVGYADDSSSPATCCPWSAAR